MPEEIFESVVRVCSSVILAVCFLGGLGLLIFPKAMARLNRALNRGYSTRKLTKPLEMTIESEQWIIAHRAVIGIIALVVSITLFLLLY